MLHASCFMLHASCLPGVRFCTARGVARAGVAGDGVAGPDSDASNLSKSTC